MQRTLILNSMSGGPGYMNRYIIKAGTPHSTRAKTSTVTVTPIYGFNGLRNCRKNPANPVLLFMSKDMDFENTSLRSSIWSYLIFIQKSREKTIIRPSMAISETGNQLYIIRLPVYRNIERPAVARSPVMKDLTGCVVTDAFFPIDFAARPAIYALLKKRGTA